MVLNDLADSFCHSQKNAGLKGLSAGGITMPCVTKCTNNKARNVEITFEGQSRSSAVVPVDSI